MKKLLLVLIVICVQNMQGQGTDICERIIKRIEAINQDEEIQLHSEFQISEKRIFSFLKMYPWVKDSLISIKDLYTQKCVIKSLFRVLSREDFDSRKERELALLLQKTKKETWGGVCLLSLVEDVKNIQTLEGKKEKILNMYDVLSRQRIQNWQRYNPEDVYDTYQLSCAHTWKKGEKLALVISPIADDNWVFDFISYQLRALREHGYRLILTECKNKAEYRWSVKYYGRDSGTYISPILQNKKYDFFYSFAHGDWWTYSLGDGDSISEISFEKIRFNGQQEIFEIPIRTDPHASITIDDIDVLGGEGGMAYMFEKNAIGIISSCLTNQRTDISKEEQYENISEMISYWLGISLYAPYIEEGLGNIEFKNNTVSGISSVRNGFAFFDLQKNKDIKSYIQRHMEGE